MESKLIQIHIKNYERDMCTELTKEKKKEILDLLVNSNNLHSEEEFKDIEENLYYALREGDIELIKIYFSETIENDSKDHKSNSIII